MSWDCGVTVRLLEVGNSLSVRGSNYERIRVVSGRVRYERRRRRGYRVIAPVPKICIIRKCIFIRKVIVLFMYVFALMNMYVFGIYSTSTALERMPGEVSQKTFV
jgi:hypothetical protein